MACDRLVLTATRKGYVSTREARNFDKEVMRASLMMTPPLGTQSGAEVADVGRSSRRDA